MVLEDGSWRPTSKAGWYLALVVIGCAGALAAGRPEAVLVVAPFATALVFGMAAGPKSAPRVEAKPATTHLTQGDELDLAVQVHAVEGSASRWCRLELGMSNAAGWRPAEEAPGRQTTHRAGLFGLATPAQVTLRATATRWGRKSPGSIVWRALDVLGLWQADSEGQPLGAVTVYPAPEVLDRLLAPARAPLPAGTHLTKGKGVGTELAGVRPYSRGDSTRDINWRATARRGRDLFTNERHPEKAGDVVLALDSFEAGALDRAVPASCALARAFLRQRDRVGIVKFGGWLRWLRPGAGPRHEWLLLDELLTTTTTDHHLYRSMTALPPRALPPGALLLVVSSLEGAGAVEAVTDMAARGLDVAVLQVEPDLHGGPDVPGGPEVSPLAVDLWRLAGDGRTDALRATGVPCAVWRAAQPLTLPVGELVMWARRVRGGRR